MIDQQQQQQQRSGNRRLILTAIAAFGLGFWAHSQVRSQDSLNGIMTVITTAMTENDDNHYNKAASTTSMYCSRNPYISVINANHLRLQRYGAEGLDAYAVLATTDPAKEHTHKRFRVFEELASCKDDVCIGGECGSDVSKIMCGLSVLNGQTEATSKSISIVGGASSSSVTIRSSANSKPPPCVVYSIGGNNLWQFELDILKRTSCEVHTFDCTGNITRFKVPSNDDGRLHFHYECLHGGITAGGTALPPGPNFLTLAEMAHKYGHTKIDLLKMDIEGFEWGVFDGFNYHHRQQHIGNASSISSNSNSIMELVLPMQILVEVHYRTQFRELFAYQSKDWKFEEDMISLARQLFQMGYIVIKHDDNRACPHCVELTLVRAYCRDV
jgi:hypothetical protein